MSELKELAFEAAAKGSPAGIVLMVFLIVGGIVQQQAPPSPPPPSLSAVSAFSNQNLFLETRVVCPSLISAETAKEKTFPSSQQQQQSRAVARKSEAEDNSNRSAAADETETNGAINLPEFSIPLLSSLLQLVPAVGLAKQGYEDLKSGSTQLVGTRWLCLAIDKNAPLIRLSVVYLLGQAGTFGASQLARFAGTRPGLTFFDRCGQDSAISACKRAARENLKRVRLLPADILVVSKINSEDGSIEDKDFSAANNESWASGRSSNTEYVFYEDDESAAEVPVLCQNTDSNFSDLFKSLHENPNFSSGSFGAATVSLLFGLCLLSRVRRSRRHQKTDSVEATQEEIDDKLLPTVSPRSACLWTIGEALAFLTAALSALALLIHFYSREPNSGSNLLLSVSLGVSVQLCLVLWSTFGNLFFDLRHLRDLGFWSRRQKQQQPTEATISSDRPAAT